MHNRFDQLAKLVTRAGCACSNRVETDAEVSPDAMRIDVWSTPDPTLPRSRLDQLGLLGRIAHSACTIEPFHNTPDGEAVMGCLSKHCLFRKQLSQRDPSLPLPTQWILSAGRPKDALDGLRFYPCERWGPGVYQGPPLTHTYLVVIRELPETRDTLLVRLMGAGRTLRRAIAELKASPEEAPESALALPIVLRVRLDVLAAPGQQAEDDKEFLMISEDIVEQYLTKQRQEGLQQGLQKGRREGLQQGRQEGVQKGVVEALLSVYNARFGQPPRDVVAAIERTNELPVLQGWLELFAVRSADEIAAALQAPPRQSPRPRQSSRPAPRRASTNKR